MAIQGQNGDNNDDNDNQTTTAPIWKAAPVLIGTTKFEPRPDVRNIMVTGGAGFMSVSSSLTHSSAPGMKFQY